jgi:hypothetical protein
VKVQTPYIIIVVGILSLPIIYLATDPHPQIPPVEQGRASPTLEMTNSEAGSLSPDASQMQTAFVKSVGGGLAEKIILVPARTNPERNAQMAKVISDSGFRCPSVQAIFSVTDIQGSSLPFYKIDCIGGVSIQATESQGRAFFKPWTGVIFGM